MNKSQYYQLINNAAKVRNDRKNEKGMARSFFLESEDENVFDVSDYKEDVLTSFLVRKTDNLPAFNFWKYSFDFLPELVQFALTIWTCTAAPKKLPHVLRNPEIFQFLTTIRAVYLFQDDAEIFDQF